MCVCVCVFHISWPHTLDLRTSVHTPTTQSSLYVCMYGSVSQTFQLSGTLSDWSRNPCFLGGGDSWSPKGQNSRPSPLPTN